MSKFVWHDLMTTDVEGAKRFYGELLGWTFYRGEGDYEHITPAGGAHPVGGMMKLHQPGVPPHWMGYVSTNDVDGTLGAVEKHGGKVLMPRRDMEKVGQFAVVADPVGATFAPFHPARQADAETEPTTFAWNELQAHDSPSAARFYHEVFGWAVETFPMEGFGSYTILKREDGKDAGGVMTIPPGAPYPPHWLVYIAVPDAAATAERFTKLGGKTMTPVLDVPNVGKFFVAMDPQGAAVGFLARPSA